MSLRDSRDNATIALWRWDCAVDDADDEAERMEANGHDARAEPGTLDPSRPPIYGEKVLR